MPHLQFETTAETTATERRAFADEITELYAEHMYAVVTEHDGEAFHERDRVLADWDATEAEEGAD